MTLLGLAALALVLYALGYRFYAPRLARAFGIDDARPTPAVTQEDGVDFVPSRPHVVFAHHFSAIAAAGPIIGPTMALLYGAGPVWLWIVLGGIFFGAAHDMACLFVSIREGGRSIAEVARRTLGTPAYALLLVFIAFNLVLVNATFLNVTAAQLVSMRSAADLGLPADQTLFRTAPGPSGEPLCVVGGIASTSAIALTLAAPLMGLLVVRRGVSAKVAYPIATALAILSVVAGFALPVTLSQDAWVLAITVYVVLAAAAPVWLILQPREFVSVQFLYTGIVLLFAGLAGAGLRGAELRAPGWNVAAGEEIAGVIWPSLFITVACGAISGFHGLVASGTTAKQIARESDIRPVAYGGMLGESALAIAVTLSVAAGVAYADYAACIVRPEGAPTGWRANPGLAFSLGVAGTLEMGLGIPRYMGVVFGLLMLEGFVLDTLDVSVRLNRYLLEELWSLVFTRVPAILRTYWANAAIAAALMCALAYGNTADRLWPIFGTGNQLFAALSLVTISVWLQRQGRNPWYTLAPGLFVAATTVDSLASLLKNRYVPEGKLLLGALAVAFLVTAIGVLAIAARAWRRPAAPG